MIYNKIYKLHKVAKIVQSIEAQRQYFEALFVNSPVAIVTLDSSHRVVSLNPAFEDLFGYGITELKGKNIDNFITDQRTVGQAKAYTQAVQEGDSIEVRGKRRRKDGKLVDVEIRGVPVMIDGHQVGALGLYLDITDQLVTQKRLEQSQARYKNLFDHSPIALWEEDWSEVKNTILSLQEKGVQNIAKYLNQHPNDLDDLAGTIQAKSFNLAAEQLFEAKSNRELVERFGETFTDNSFRFFIDVLSAFYSGTRKWVADAEMKTLEGNEINLSILASIPPVKGDSWSTVYLSALDITENKLLQNQLTEALHKMKILATTDELTGLLNRRAITELIEEELARCEREKSNFGLAIVDVDDLKKINDELGHNDGDQALRLIAEEITANIRRYDKAGRWGGDEFIILMPGVTADTANAVTDRVGEAISEKRMRADGRMEIDLSVSIGFSIFDGANSQLSLDELVAQADLAMYKAKELGDSQSS